jgi:hypothetical protein
MFSSLLNSKMLIAIYTINDLLAQIKKIESDVQIPIIEKLSQIKNIKEAISKVGEEVDNIKREITLLSSHKMN